MIRALINNNWVQVPKNDLKIGTKTFAYKAGLYETFRTINYQPILLKTHLKRLFNNANSIGLNIGYPIQDIIRMLKQVIHEFSEPDQRVYIIAIPDNFIIYTSPLNLDSAIYNGVDVITIEGVRQTPEIKTTNKHICQSALEKAHKSGCFEAFLVDSNRNIYEGSKSNIFWVKNEELFAKSNNVLIGTTQTLIKKHSPFPINDGTLNEQGLKTIDELFITNSGSGIVPVISVNNQPINNYKIGNITAHLLTLYKEWINKETSW